MKYYTFDIDVFQQNWIFSPLRSRNELITLLMKTLQIMQAYVPPPETMKAGRFVLLVSKTSRLFYVSTEKVFSIYFPFSIKESGQELTFFSRIGLELDSRMTSIVMEILQSPNFFDGYDVLEFADLIDTAAKYDPEIWTLLRELLTSEEGYLRYDYDTERQNGKRHPLHHLDIFYSPSTTFKVGLSGAMALKQLEDILDPSTDCYYLVVPD